MYVDVFEATRFSIKRPVKAPAHIRLSLEVGVLAYYTCRALLATAMAIRATKSATRLGVISRHVCGSASATTAEVTFERRGSVAWLTLARPKALNALTLPMIRALHPALEQSVSDASVRCIVMVGEGGKAFCAGGDVRAVCEAAQAGDAALPDAFFREEYQLNHALARSPKPQVSVWDGIVMGGGAGLSVHGRFRVATERTLFAMPETGIGFFPDVGGSHFLQARGLGSGLGLGLALSAGGRSAQPEPLPYPYPLTRTPAAKPNPHPHPR